MEKKTSVMKKEAIVICLVIVVGCVILALVDGYWKPPYAVKAAGKVVLFAVVPLACAWWLGRKKEFFAVFRPDRKALTLGTALGLGTMVLILGGYALLSPWLDLSAIPAAMAANGGITADNFLYAGTWIALCNSLMEEIFVRGFSFLTLKQVSSRKLAYVVSASFFSLYHAAIVDGWVSPALYVLMLAALFGCGLFFNWLDESRGRIWVSWFMHMGANVAINLIGMKLLGMI